MEEKVISEPEDEFKGYEESDINRKRKSVYNNNKIESKMANKTKRINIENDAESKMEATNTHNTNTKNDPEIKYKNTDKGPFYVMVDAAIPKTMLSIILSKIFKENNVKTRNIIEVNKKIARIEFDSFDKANRCIRKDDPIHKILTDKGYKCYIPKAYTHVEGVVKGLLGEFDINEIKENMVCEYPITQMEIIKSWDRETRTLKDTNILKIEIRASELPRNVLFYDIKIKTDIYIPKLKFCSICLSYGHIKKYCHSKIKRCTKCAKPVVMNQIHECKENPECRFCEGVEHYTNSRQCPEKKKQNKIKIYMIKNKTTYKETISTLYPKQYKIYKEPETQNLPPINKNAEENIPNAWIERANRHEQIVKEQRERR